MLLTQELKKRRIGVAFSVGTTARKGGLCSWTAHGQTSPEMIQQHRPTASVERGGLMRTKDLELEAGAIDGEPLEMGEKGGSRGYHVGSSDTPPLVVVAYV